MRMLLDFDVRSCSRWCVATELTIQPGEVYYSVLLLQGAEMARLDYRAEAWKGPPEDSFGWWRSRVPTTNGAKAQLAPRDVLLNLLVELAELPAETEFRYVLALVLLRRRLLRLEETRTDETDRDWMVLVSPYRDQPIDVQVAMPEENQTAPLQQRLIDLLYGDSEDVRC